MKARSILIVSALACSFAFAEEPVKKIIATEAPSEMINKATCTLGGDTRELEILGKDGGHVVNYTKAGAVKEVGSCMTSKDKCQQIFDGIKGKLEAAGFACKT